MWIIMLYKGKVCIFFLSFMHVFWVILNPYLFSPGAWGRNQRKSNSRLTGIIVMKMHWFYYFFLFLSFCCCFFLSYSICPSMYVCVCVCVQLVLHTHYPPARQGTLRSLSPVNSLSVGIGWYRLVGWRR